MTNLDDKDQVIKDYLHFVRGIAERLIATNNIPKTFIEDLVQSGLIGLIQASNGYDSDRKNSVNFKTFATFRIRGEMLDFLREEDSLPRNIRIRNKEKNKLMNDVFLESGRRISPEDMAEYFGMSVEDWISKYETYDVSLVSMDTDRESLNGEKEYSLIDLIIDERAIPSDKLLLMEERREALYNYIETSLTEKERLVIKSYYLEDLKMYQIADMMSLTESRVSQINFEAIKKIKKAMSRIFSD